MTIVPLGGSGCPVLSGPAVVDARMRSRAQGFRVQGLGFRVQGLGFRVRGCY